jgi:lysine biosynthesis protein LysW
LYCGIDGKGESRMTIRGNGRGSIRPPYRDWSTDGYPEGDLERGVCPGCGDSITFNDAAVGDRVDCGECGEKLEVISLSPIDLDYAFEDEDWQDFEDWEEGDEGGDEKWDDEEEESQLPR